MEEKLKETPESKPAGGEYKTAGEQLEMGRLIAFLVVAVVIIVGTIVLSKVL